MRSLNRVSVNMYYMSRETQLLGCVFRCDQHSQNVNVARMEACILKCRLPGMLSGEAQ